MSEADSERVWRQAKLIGGKLSPVPPPVLHAIQVLWLEWLRTGSNTEVSPEAIASIRGLQMLQLLKAPLYFGARELQTDRVSGTGSSTDWLDLLRAHGVGFFSVLLALSYFQRRVMKLAPAEAAESLSQDLIADMELGYLLGQSSPALGVTEGTLVGGVRQAAMGAMLVANADQYSRYRNLHRGRLNRGDELERWQCTHVEVSAYLLRLLTMVSDVHTAAKALQPNGDSHGLDERQTRWQAATAWIDGLKEGKSPPKAVSAGALEIAPAQAEKLRARASEITSGNSGFKWMLKSSKDLEGE